MKADRPGRRSVLDLIGPQTIIQKTGSRYYLMWLRGDGSLDSLTRALPTPIMLPAYCLQPNATMRNKRLLLTHFHAGVALLLLWLVTPTHVSSQGAQAMGGEVCSPAGIRPDVRPDPAGRPTEVSVAQSLTGDFMVLETWSDPRLAEMEGCQLPLTSVWHPQLDFLNSGLMQPRRSEDADQVEIGPEGLVQHQQRYFGSLATYRSLRAFPFDRQVFEISLLSPEYAEDELRLVVNDRQTGRRELLNITDWTIDSVTATIDTYVVETTGRRLSTFEFGISAHRQVGFYIWKVIVPLILIVAISWTVFWVRPAQFGPQIGLSATAMLTLIAFQFALVSVLPKLAYFTVLDEFIIGSTILVFVALVEAVTTSYLVSKERTPLALRVDAVSRWAFPAAFGLLTLFVFAI